MLCNPNCFLHLLILRTYQIFHKKKTSSVQRILYCSFDAQADIKEYYKNLCILIDLHQNEAEIDADAALQHFSLKLQFNFSLKIYTQQLFQSLQRFSTQLYEIARQCNGSAKVTEPVNTCLLSAFTNQTCVKTQDRITHVVQLVIFTLFEDFC